MLRMRPHILFFDRPKVIQAVDKATRGVLSRFGSFVRTTARHSIRKRKSPSPPGQPPRNRTGLLKRFIFFAYEPQDRSVVIGPARLNRSTGAPEILEYGGTATVRTNKKNHKVTIAARPYMGPAFEKEKQTLPSLWKDSVKSSS